MFDRYWLVGALFLGWIAIASAQGQDSPAIDAPPGARGAV